MGNKLVSEFFCERRLSLDEEVYTKNFQPANVSVQVFEDNLAVMSFVNNNKEIGKFRLCWGAYLGFVEAIEEWFFDGDDTMTAGSCIDNGIVIQCTAHSDYSISITLSLDKGKNYNIVFCADRSKFLSAMDNAAMAVEKLVPNQPQCHDQSDNRILH